MHLYNYVAVSLEHHYHKQAEHIGRVLCQVPRISMHAHVRTHTHKQQKQDRATQASASNTQWQRKWFVCVKTKLAVLGQIGKSMQSRAAAVSAKVTRIKGF